MNGQIIDITPDEKEVVRSATVALPDNARAIRVVDHVSKVAANDFFLRCREARKLIAAHYDPKIEEWKAAKQLADGNRAKMVAEKTAAEAPIVALIALCSDSTATNSVFTLPSATNWENIWAISVAGVIGYAATTSGFIWRMASAIASLPVFACFCLFMFFSWVL